MKHQPTVGEAVMKLFDDSNLPAETLHKVILRAANQSFYAELTARGVTHNQARLDVVASGRDVMTTWNRVTAIAQDIAWKFKG